MLQLLSFQESDATYVSLTEWDRCIRTTVIADSGVKCMKVLTSRWLIGCLDGSVHNCKNVFQMSQLLFPDSHDIVLCSCVVQWNPDLHRAGTCTSHHTRYELIFKQHE